MIGSKVISENIGLYDALKDGRGDQEVINAPPHISGARIGKVAEVGVFDGIRVEKPKGIDEACIEHLLEFMTLFCGEAW